MKQSDEFKKIITNQQRAITMLEDKLTKLDPTFVPEGHEGMPPDCLPPSDPPRLGGGRRVFLEPKKSYGPPRH